MLNKKILLLLLFFVTFFYFTPCEAGVILNEDDISAAKISANKLAKKKKIIFAYSSSSEAYVKNFNDDDEEQPQEKSPMIMATAWWLNPYSHLISEQLVEGRSSRIDTRALDFASRTYELRIMIELRKYDKETIESAQISILQGDRVLPVISKRYTGIQYSAASPATGEGTRTKIGIVFEIDTKDVEDGKPIDLKIEGIGSPLTITYLKNNRKYNSYDTKSHDSFETKRQEFRWLPLHDSLG